MNLQLASLPPSLPPRLAAIPRLPLLLDGNLRDYRQEILVDGVEERRGEGRGGKIASVAWEVGFAPLWLRFECVMLILRGCSRYPIFKGEKEVSGAGKEG